MPFLQIFATTLFVGIVVYLFLTLRSILNEIFGTSRWTVYLVAWLVIQTAASLTGIVDFSGMPPRFMPFIMIPLATAFIVPFKGQTRRWLGAQSYQRLIAPQSFRIVMEVVLWLLFLGRLMPQLMTFEGRNWDIIVGIGAVIAPFMIARASTASGQRRIALLFNVIGLALLINVTIHGIGSTPSALRIFETEPANTLVLTFPWIWLPGFVVPAAFFLHVLSLRRSLLHNDRSGDQAL